MIPFIRNDQFNFIKNKMQALINGHATVTDKAVLGALKSLTVEKILAQFEKINEEQKQLLNPIVEVKEKADGEQYLEQLEPFVIPFKLVTESSVKKLFPKAKKLKLPSLEEMNLKEITYLGWIDKGSNKKFLIVEHNDKIIGISGEFKHSSKKGICALCNRFEEIGMFTSTIKGIAPDAFITRGNYICQDSMKCNQNLITLEKLNEFISLVSGK